MSNEEKKNLIELRMVASIIPHTVDGKHSVEAVFIDPRWPSLMKVPRPAVTVEIAEPYDPNSGLEKKIRARIEKSLIDFMALGVTASMLHRVKKAHDAEHSDGAPETPGPDDETPLLSVGKDGKPLSLPEVIGAFQKAGVSLPAGVLAPSAQGKGKRKRKRGKRRN